MTVGSFDDYAEAMTSKYIPEYLNLGPSNLLHHTVYEYYLNECGKRYVNSGTRNISHETGVQDYLIARFGCERAYARLRVEYNPKIRPIIRLVYPFRGVLKPLSRVKKVNQLLSVLKMEEIVRRQKKSDKSRAKGKET